LNQSVYSRVAISTCSAVRQGPARGGRARPGRQAGSAIRGHLRGCGSALVAVAYAPASAALNTWAQRLCDELFPLGEADTAAVILKQAEDHGKLEQLLGADRGVAAGLQAGLVILGPLIASAAAAFLPH
jgi:hypothetical protein